MEDSQLPLSKDNAKCENFFSLPEFDGLKQDWSKYGICWMNPPYGRGIGAWMEKAYLTGRAGGKVICLTFARTDTKWWHEWATKAAEIYFLKGRVKFVKGAETNSAPYPSCILVFTPGGNVPLVKFIDPKTERIVQVNPAEIVSIPADSPNKVVSHRWTEIVGPLSFYDESGSMPHLTASKKSV